MTIIYELIAAEEATRGGHVSERLVTFSLLSSKMSASILIDGLTAAWVPK